MERPRNQRTALLKGRMKVPCIQQPRLGQNSRLLSNSQSGYIDRRQTTTGVEELRSGDNHEDGCRSLGSGRCVGWYRQWTSMSCDDERDLLYLGNAALVLCHGLPRAGCHCSYHPGQGAGIGIGDPRSGGSTLDPGTGGRSIGRGGRTDPDRAAC